MLATKIDFFKSFPSFFRFIYKLTCPNGSLKTETFNVGKEFNE